MRVASVQPTQNAQISATADTSRPSGRGRVKPFLRLFLPFLIVGAFAIWNLSSWPARIGYPGDESYEDFALTDMVHVRSGIPIYSTRGGRGFSDATYGPLYYLLGGRLVDPAHPSYFPLRLLSAFAMLGCAGLCGLLGFRLTGKPLAAALSPVLFLAWGMVTGHGILALSDGMAVFLAFAGFLVAYRFRNGGGLLLAAPLMVMSFYYKPQYIAGPAAVLLFLAIEKRYRLACEFATVLAASGLGLLAFFQFVVFRGEQFYQYFLFHQAPLLSWAGFLRRTIPLFGLVMLPPVILAVSWVRDHRDKLIACYLVCAAALGVLTYSKDMSGAQYFFELVLLLSVLLSAVLAEKLDGRVYPLDVVMFVFVVLVVQQVLAGPGPRPRATDVAKYDAVQSFLQSNFTQGSASLSTISADALQAGLGVPYSGIFVLTTLYSRGRMSDSSLVSQISGDRFAVIILGIDLDKETDPYWINFVLTQGMRTAIRNNYQLVASFDMPVFLKHRPQDKFYIYAPRTRTNRVSVTSELRTSRNLSTKGNSLGLAQGRAYGPRVLIDRMPLFLEGLRESIRQPGMAA